MASLPVRTIFLRALRQLHCLRLPVNYIKSAKNIHTMVPLRVTLKPLSILHRSPFLSPSHCGFHTTSPINWGCTRVCGLPIGSGDGGSSRKPASSAALNPRPQDIRLVLEGGSVQVMTKAKAEVLATERNLKLVLRDAKSRPHPTYELMTGKQLAEERTRIQELKRAAKKKAPKELKLTSRISPHDLEIKLKKVIEWLQKGQDVKIAIKMDAKLSEKATVEVFKYMTDNTKDLATVGQSQKSASDLVYVLKSMHSEPTTVTSNLKPYTVSELKQQAVDNKKPPKDTPSE